MDGNRITKNDTACHVTIGLNDRCKGKQQEKREDAKLQSRPGQHLEGTGQRVTAEGLGQGSRDRTVRFNIMEERKSQKMD